MKFSPGNVVEDSIRCQKIDGNLHIEYLTYAFRTNETSWERRFEWKPTQLFCPGCGSKRKVYASEDIREDNAGEQHLCLNCGFGFMHPIDEQYNEVPTLVIEKMMEVIV